MRTKIRVLSRVSAAALAVTVIAGLSSTLASAGGVPVVVRVKQDLMPTSLAPDAMGEASVRFRGENEGVEVEIRAKAEGLPGGHDVSLCVKHLQFDRGMTDDRGRINLRGVVPVAEAPSDGPVRVMIRAGVDCEGSTLLFGRVIGL